MDSKELIEKIKHCGIEEWRLAAEKIEKDLEILDIIKNSAYIFHFDNDGKVSSIGTCEQSNLTKEEINILGEWLLKEKIETRWVDGVKVISSPTINTFG